MKIELTYIVYLDWNVIANLESGQLPRLEKKLFDLKNKNAISIPFSAEHIKESCNIKSKKDTDKRLEYISKLSSNLYFDHDLQSTEYRAVDPKLVHDNISKSHNNNEIEKEFYKIINYDVLRDIRKLLKLDPAKLNNISPKNAIDEINKVLASQENKEKFWKDYDGDLTFIGIIKTTVDIIEKTFPFKSLYYENKYNRLLCFIMMIFLSLDSFGFWSDKREAHELGSHRVDSQHAFNGTFANLVISADRRFCMKSKATYGLLSIGTKVLNLKIDKDEIMQLLEAI